MKGSRGGTSRAVGEMIRKDGVWMFGPVNGGVPPWLRYGIWLICLSAFGILASSCSTTGPTTGARLGEKSANPTRKSVVVLHTNDNWGEVEPCG